MLVDEPTSLKDRNVYRLSLAPDDDAVLLAPEKDCGYGLLN
jgi:hypothetical protein